MGTSQPMQQQQTDHERPSEGIQDPTQPPSCPKDGKSHINIRPPSAPVDCAAKEQNS